MHDVEALAERVIVIGHGRVLADGAFQDLRAGVFSERRISVEFAGPAPVLDLPGVEVRSRHGSSVALAFDPRTISAAALIARIAGDHPVEDIHIEEPPIEEVIARFYDLHGAGEA
jgi:ABC-2 type transport system ATP-binding protein